MRICDQRRDALGRACTPDHAQPLLHAALALCPRRQTLEALVQHPLDRALRDAEVARAQALVEAPDARLPEYLPDHRGGPAEEGARARELGLVRVELEAGLDDPDRVRRGAGRDAGEGGGGEVHVRVLHAVVEARGDDLLAVAVGEEVDGARGDDADERRAEALEECARGLVQVDVPAAWGTREDSDKADRGGAGGRRTG